MDILFSVTRDSRRLGEVSGRKESRTALRPGQAMLDAGRRSLLATTKNQSRYLAAALKEDSETGQSSPRKAYCCTHINSRLKMPPPFPRPGEPPVPTPPHPADPTALLRLKIQDLSHPGARRFLSSVGAADVLEEAVHTVVDLLYPGRYRGSWPGTRSVTLVLSAFDHIAYTRGISIDDDHKEIHLSTKYIASIKPELLKAEIKGVIVHEMVHCWQWNGRGTAPTGLIEGIADWVRLRADLAPPQWKRNGGDRWNAGYQITAWFLDWLENHYGGSGTVPLLNLRLKDTEYDEKRYWSDQGIQGLHKSVHELWEQYKRWLADQGGHQDVYELREHHKRLSANQVKTKEGPFRVEEEEDQGSCEGMPSASECARKSSVETGDTKVDEEAGSEKDDDEDDHSQHKKSDGAESELENGWTDLSSGES